MIRSVAGAADPALEAYRSVGDPRALERAGLFVAEGRLVVERLIEDGRFRLHSVLVTAPAAAALAPIFERRPNVDVGVCEPALLEAVTGFDFHRGCLALAWRDSPVVSLESFADAPRLLALEGVGNPDNVGGLFRTASAFGIDGILLDPSAGDPLYRKAIRTSMGATLRVPFTRSADWPVSIDALRRARFRIVALTPHQDAVALDTVDVAPGDKVVLLVGSEGDGLSADSLRRADVQVRIPIDPRADSLNAVVAAAIALHRLR